VLCHAVSSTRDSLIPAEDPGPLTGKPATAPRARRRVHLRGSLPGSIRSMRIYRIACLDESVPGVRRGARREQAPGLADRDPADACRGMKSDEA